MSETDALKASFNAQLKAVTDAAVQPEPEPALKEVPAKKEPEAKAEPVIPPSIMAGKEDAKPTDADEPLVSEEVRAVLKGKPRESFDTLEKNSLARIKALKAELAEARSKQTIAANPEIETALKTERERAAALEQQLERSAYERSPKFQRFGAEEKAELATAKSYLEGTEINPAILEAAANSTGAARIKILRDAQVDPETVAAVSSHLARIDSIRRERDASLENWKTGLAQDQQAQAARQKQIEAQQIENEKKVFTEVRDRLKTMPAFTKVDGHEKWNEGVEVNLKEAEDFFHGRKSLAELAELGFRGVAQKTTELMNVELTKQLKEANERLTKLQAAQPRAGKPADPKVEKPNPDAAKDQTEHYKSSFNTELSKLRG